VLVFVLLTVVTPLLAVSFSFYCFGGLVSFLFLRARIPGETEVRDGGFGGPRA